MAKHKITDWTITAVVERPDGTWYDHTITDFPEHIGITINEWLQDYKTIEEESNEEEKYKIVASQTIYATYEIEIEADNEKQAEEKALNTYINDWDDERFENGDALTVDEIEEIE